MRARGRSPSARGLVLVHPQHRRGAVGDLRRRARRVNSALQHRLQRRQALERGVAQALVPGDGARSRVGCLFSSSTGASMRLISRSKRPSAQACLALRCESKPNSVDLLAGDAAALGDPLGGGELIGQVDVPGRGPQDAAIGARVGAQPDPAHRLDAAGDADVDGARRDEAGDQMRWPAEPLPHWQSTVIAPTCSGRPATSQPTRVMLLDCSPNCVTQPPMTCSTLSRRRARPSRRAPSAWRPATRWRAGLTAIRFAYRSGCEWLQR